MGESSILLANVLVDPAGIRYVASELDRDPEFTFLCYVDSLAGVEILERVLTAIRATRPWEVLVELGQVGGRTGARSISDAVEVARAVTETKALRLAGVAGFEGLIHSVPKTMIQAVDDFLLSMRDLVVTIDREALFGPRVIVTAGGSAYFDRVVQHLTGFSLSSPVQTILRSGGYITHDAEMYELVSPLARRRAPGETLRLSAALELWATVWSRPERSLAIVGFGKRDASFDYGLPIPLKCYRGGNEVEPNLIGMASVTELNDQHAYLQLDEELELLPGDVLLFGMSHPCTVFDKWRTVPVVDDTHNVIDLVHTFF
jgi:D-serine deaminase-like pyridoxal phosphate-dependent protein